MYYNDILENPATHYLASALGYISVPLAPSFFGVVFAIDMTPQLRTNKCSSFYHLDPRTLILSLEGALLFVSKIVSCQPQKNSRSPMSSGRS